MGHFGLSAPFSPAAQFMTLFIRTKATFFPYNEKICIN